MAENDANLGLKQTLVWLTLVDVRNSVEAAAITYKGVLKVQIFANQSMYVDMTRK